MFYNIIREIIEISVADPGSGMNNPNHISESLETVFGAKILCSLMRIWDGKNSDPGSGINIPDPQH
jgi:hypothetical protein